MLSTIVEGANQQARANYLLSLNTTITKHLSPDPLSIGIKAIQELVVDLSLSSQDQRIVWIEEAQTLTKDASGALLKVLEEPPANTLIYLTCPNKQALLSTILSRCQIYSLQNTKYEIKNTKYLPSLKPLFALSLGDRLSHLSDFPSDKTELLEYFSSLATELTQTIKTTTAPASLRLLSLLSNLVLNTHAALRQNLNPNLALTHFLLHLPKLK